MSCIVMPCEAASSLSSLSRGSNSSGLSQPLPSVFRLLNSWRRSSSNSASKEDKQAAANSKYSQDPSWFTSRAEAMSAAWLCSRPSFVKAGTISELSSTPLLSVSICEKRLANFFRHVHPTAIFKHKARCIGFRPLHSRTAFTKASRSFGERQLRRFFTSQKCWQASSAVGLFSSLTVSSFRCRSKASSVAMLENSCRSGPF
mmetsp:Transcript_22853/g.53462  ORF Transcript_22853/g.53462 Transcript_22853/m.53462 type:complete len:202 (-) Transcript_22853:940-1545(-)